MDIHITRRYLKIGIGFEAVSKNLSFYHEGTLVLDLDLRMDMHAPDTYAYLDMARFLDKRLQIRVMPEIALRFELVDVPDETGIYTEKYRPAAHFSAKRGWLNDPNGLFYDEGRYHMFFQHNPVDLHWGNIHWGHAVSSDLVHWEQLPDALFPDTLGLVFSGSAIIDSKNLTGLGNGEHAPILLFYTAGGGCSTLSAGKEFSQCLAYSTDGGITFVKYGGNPLIPTMTGSNRDPKVVFDPVCGMYYMALYMEKNTYAVFTSANLLDWKKSQEIILSEDSECPDFYPLRLGKQGTRYWVYSGASDRYLIGTVTNGYFKQIQPAHRLHYGDSHYAAQTFSHVPDTDGRTLRIAWNRAPIPASGFNGAMCFPVEMSLRQIDGNFMLCALPVGEISLLYRKRQVYESIVVETGMAYRCGLEGKAQDLLLEFDEVPDRFDISLLGYDIHVEAALNRLECKTGTMPLFARNGRIKLRILTDTNGLEIFADQGQAHFCAAHIADYNLDALVLKAGASPLKICQLQVASLRSIWTEQTGKGSDG